LASSVRVSSTAVGMDMGVCVGTGVGVCVGTGVGVGVGAGVGAGVGEAESAGCCCCSVTKPSGAAHGPQIDLPRTAAESSECGGDCTRRLPATTLAESAARGAPEAAGGRGRVAADICAAGS
jgi:hypothetical protein